MEAAVVVLITFLLLAAVVRFVGAPLRVARRAARSGGAGQGDGSLQPGGDGAPGGGAASDTDTDGPARAQRETLEAAREAKYREIRDAELDYRTGKLSPEDYEAIDAMLRAEAIAILDRLDPPGAQPRA